MSKYRKSARGQLCQVRIPGVCNHNPETVVLAHLGGAGMGMKSLDIHGAYACSSCHDEIDRRTRICTLEFARLCHLEGMVRTQTIMIKDGILKL